MFKKVLAEQWALLSPAVKQHYGIADGEEISMQGELAVKHELEPEFSFPLVMCGAAR